MQRKGEPIEEVYPDDVVCLKPIEKHRHGAVPTDGMTHIAIQENLNCKVVDWREKVTGDRYQE
ncbi:hypothetical protein [Pontibacter korlensis]|uniref:hypothetical protein n=1 Tax=Pontibacter korlensis TaxID=400092 RepID=UPI0011DD1BF9|nr:hypothetical protein [Pontibacter korlensis]